MRVLLLVIVLAASVAAQEARIESLGLGRSRLELDLRVREALRPGDGGRVEIGRLRFRERWLVRELPRLFPALESVAVIERIQARSGESGLAAAEERLLEIVGPDDAVAAAGRRLGRLGERKDLRIRARVWVARLRAAAPEGRAPGLEILGDAALGRRLAELAASEGAQIVETADLELANGEEGRVAVGNTIEYLRDHRISSAAGRLFVEPLRDSVQEGLRFGLGALLDPEAGRLQVEADLVLARVARPIARLEGGLGPEGERLVIEKPVVAETRWGSSGIALGPAEVGFRVTGLEEPRPAGDEGPAQALEVLCQITAVAAESRDEGGLVQGFDRREGLAFALVEEGARVAGDLVLFERDGLKIGHGRIEEILGRLAAVTVLAGEPRQGDRLR